MRIYACLVAFQLLQKLNVAGVYKNFVYREWLVVDVNLKR
ncbi:hypothetical protein GMES_4403 [Paraglaciecola mesophila KMM 241]|uniref:Uncharacterized protein n=1 Tax=Paraglaciecola mesophila KMM 241 TaxID=1128912 RepID=K6Y1F7_9ALTE|nr:hypothetical protein GMES_4403 [Paraglaciecola mesophila KMM 241]